MREVSEDEIGEYERATEHLREFVGSEDLLQICRNNEREFTAGLSGLQVLASRDSISPIRDKPLILEVNRRLFNLLTSLRLYADYNETRFKRRFGKASDEVRALRRILANAFDNSFSYRFLYKLRGYAQHCGLPIEHIQTISRLREDGTPEHLLEVMFNTESLLTKGQRYWGPLVYKDLERAPRLMEVESVVAKLIPVLNGVQDELEEAERASLLDSGRTALGLVGDVYLRGAEPALGRIGVGSPPKTLRLLYLPLELLERIGLPFLEESLNSPP